MVLEEDVDVILIKKVYLCLQVSHFFKKFRFNALLLFVLLSLLQPPTFHERELSLDLLQLRAHIVPHPYFLIRIQEHLVDRVDVPIYEALEVDEGQDRVKDLLECLKGHQVMMILPMVELPCQLHVRVLDRTIAVVS